MFSKFSTTRPPVNCQSRGATSFLQIRLLCCSDLSLVGRRQATREVVALAAAGKIVPRTETHRLDEANDMLRALKEG
jgi:hypothetical protein